MKALITIELRKRFVLKADKQKGRYIDEKKKQYAKEDKIRRELNIIIIYIIKKENKKIRRQC